MVRIYVFIVNIDHTNTEDNDNMQGDEEEETSTTKATVLPQINASTDGPEIKLEDHNNEYPLDSANKSVVLKVSNSCKEIFRKLIGFKAS